MILQKTTFIKVQTFFQTFWKELFKIYSPEWSRFMWMERQRQERNRQSWTSGKCTLQGIHTLTQLTLCSGFVTGNVISRGSSSSCIFVTSIFISMSWFPSWQDVRHVPLYERGSTFSKSIQFCKSTIPFSVMTGLSLHDISIHSLQLFCTTSN
jgi:hypothetical protein